MSISDQMEQRMKALRVRFIERALRDATDLASANAQGDIQTIIRISHSLAGNAGMFGFPEISERAHDLEVGVAEEGLRAHGASLRALLAQLHRIAREPVSASHLSGELKGST